MRKLLKKLEVLTVFCLLSFALVSCGGDDDNGDPELPLSKEQELTKL